MSRSVSLEEISDDVLNYLYDRDWCKEHGIKYSNPNVKRVTEIVYYNYIERGYKILQ